MNKETCLQSLGSNGEDYNGSMGNNV